MHGKKVTSCTYLLALFCTPSIIASNHDRDIVLSKKEFRSFLQRIISRYSQEYFRTAKQPLAKIKNLREKQWEYPPKLAKKKESLLNFLDLKTHQLAQKSKIYAKSTNKIATMCHNELEKEKTSAEQKVQKICTTILYNAASYVNNQKEVSSLKIEIERCILDNVTKKYYPAIIYFIDQLNEQARTIFKYRVWTRAINKNVIDIYPYLDDLITEMENNECKKAKFITFFQEIINRYSQEKLRSKAALAESKKIKEKIQSTVPIDVLHLTKKIKKSFIASDKIINNLPMSNGSKPEEKNLTPKGQKACTALLQVAAFCLNAEQTPQFLKEAIKECIFQNVTEKNYPAVIYFTNQLTPEICSKLKIKMLPIAADRGIQDLFPYLHYFPTARENAIYRKNQFSEFLQKIIKRYCKERNLSYNPLPECKNLEQELSATKNFDIINLALTRENTFNKIDTKITKLYHRPIAPLVTATYTAIIEKEIKDIHEICIKKEKELRARIQELCTTMIRTAAFCLNTKNISPELQATIKERFLFNINKHYYQAVIYFTKHLSQTEEIPFKNKIKEISIKKELEEIYPYLNYFPKKTLLASSHFDCNPTKIAPTNSLPAPIEHPIKTPLKKKLNKKNNDQKNIKNNKKKDNKKR